MTWIDAWQRRLGCSRECCCAFCVACTSWMHQLFWGCLMPVGELASAKAVDSAPQLIHKTTSIACSCKQRWKSMQLTCWSHAM
jgi:hypothetical protein